MKKRSGNVQTVVCVCIVVFFSSLSMMNLSRQIILSAKSNADKLFDVYTVGSIVDLAAQQVFADYTAEKLQGRLNAKSIIDVSGIHNEDVRLCLQNKVKNSEITANIQEQMLTVMCKVSGIEVKKIYNLNTKQRECFTIN